MPEATVDGAIVYYEVAGTGFPLVLLHGIGSNSRSWNRQISTLSQKFKVIAWDAPGYGRSSDPPASIKPSMHYYANCLRGLLDYLKLPKIFLLGHSMGGVIAQEFYRTHSEYVEALILSDTRYASSTEGLEQRLQSIRSMTPAQLAAERAPKLLSRYAGAALVDEVASIMSEVRPVGYEFAAIALAECDTRGVVRKLGVPALLIWGAEDEITPLWEELPEGAQVMIIPSAGHLCYIEQPERFNEGVVEFLSRLDV